MPSSNSYSYGRIYKTKRHETYRIYFLRKLPHDTIRRRGIGFFASRSLIRIAPSTNSLPYGMAWNRICITVRFGTVLTRIFSFFWSLYIFFVGGMNECRTISTTTHKNYTILSHHLQGPTPVLTPYVSSKHPKAKCTFRAVLFPEKEIEKLVVQYSAVPYFEYHGEMQCNKLILCSFVACVFLLLLVQQLFICYFALRTHVLQSV